MTYDFDFKQWFCEPTNFKATQAGIIVNTLCNSRLMKQLRFSSYCHAEFDPDDSGFKHPYITEQELYNRLKTNCLSFDLLHTTENPGRYNKCFVFVHSSYKDVVNYMLVFYNTETGDVIHHWHIHPEVDEICKHINTILTGFLREPIINMYAQKYDGIKKRNGVTHVPAVGDFENLRIEMDDKLGNVYQRPPKTTKFEIIHWS